MGITLTYFVVVGMAAFDEGDFSQKGIVKEETTKIWQEEFAEVVQRAEKKLKPWWQIHISVME